MKSTVKFPVGQWPKFLSPDEEQVHGCIFITGFLSPGEEKGDVSYGTCVDVRVTLRGNVWTQIRIRDKKNMIVPYLYQIPYGNDSNYRI